METWEGETLYQYLANKLVKFGAYDYFSPIGFYTRR